jgi:hypothetical protein
VKLPAVVKACCPITADVVIELLAALAGPVPIAFVAVTVKVYDVEEVRPETVIVPDPA